MCNTLFNVYINDAPQTHDVHLALFPDNTCPYATDRKEGYVVRKLQCSLSSMEVWCECWNVKINEDKSQGIYFSHSALAYYAELIESLYQRDGVRVRNVFNILKSVSMHLSYVVCSPLCVIWSF
jgi:hypothetical protein